MKKEEEKIPKLCLVSSSGGHWDQLLKLNPLVEKYSGFYVSEETKYKSKANYLMKQTDLKDKLLIPKMIVNFIRAIRIWNKEKPDFIITTGTIVAYPFYILCRIYKKKFIYIETFARANMPTKAGLKMQDNTDLFIVQWESQKRFYKNAIYGGCLY